MEVRHDIYFDFWEFQEFSCDEIDIIVFALFCNEWVFINHLYKENIVFFIENKAQIK